MKPKFKKEEKSNFKSSLKKEVTKGAMVEQVANLLKVNTMPEERKQCFQEFAALFSFSEFYHEYIHCKHHKQRLDCTTGKYEEIQMKGNSDECKLCARLRDCQGEITCKSILDENGTEEDQTDDLVLKTELLSNLKEIGFDINGPSEYDDAITKRKTPLMQAIDIENIDWIKALIAVGAEVTLLVYSFESSLQKQADILQLLLANSSPEQSNELLGYIKSIIKKNDVNTLVKFLKLDMGAAYMNQELIYFAAEVNNHICLKVQCFFLPILGDYKICMAFNFLPSKTKCNKGANTFGLCM